MIINKSFWLLLKNILTEAEKILIAQRAKLRFVTPKRYKRLHLFGQTKEVTSLVRNNKTMLNILNNYILQRFCSIEFYKVLFSNKFFNFTFPSKMTVHTSEKDQTNCFAQNKPGKITFFYVQTTVEFRAAVIIYVYSSLWSLVKRLFLPFKEMRGFAMYYTMNDHHIR